MLWLFVCNFKYDVSCIFYILTLYFPPPFQIYASSDVHVSASEFETLGNTVLEAHACSIPVVVPDAG